MASKSAQQEPEKAEVIEEALDALDTLLDRVKVLYEQYFLGIQKQAPAYLHSDVERKLRDLAQLQIRNTALRYRFVTLQQKYGSYHTYWRRTLREIEGGKYHRSLSRVSRHAAATGAEIPYEILASMPRRMREQVRRDREAQLALQLRRGAAVPDEPALVHDTLVDDEDYEYDVDGAGFVRESTDVRQQALRAHILDPTGLRPAPRAEPVGSPPHDSLSLIDESDGELDLEAFFRSVEAEELPLPPPLPAAAAPVAPAVPEPPPAAPEPPPAADARFPDFIAVRTPAGPPAVRAASIGAPARPSSPGLASARPSTTRPLTPPFGQPVIGRPPTGQPVPPPVPAPPAPSQQARPNPITPGSSIGRPPVAVDTLAGPFPREAPPPGMTEAEVSALYARYVQAKQTIGQPPGPGSYGKLMKTIHAQAPKIMEQYRAKGVEFSVVVQDGQVIIVAKPRM